MTDGKITLRQVRFKDLAKICEWTTDEKWNIPLTEYEIMFKYSHDNWICVEVDGHMAGCVLYANICNRYGFIGIVVVSPSYRRKGLGGLLMTKAMTFCETSDFHLALNSMKPVRGLYRKYGFNNETWVNLYYHGRPNVSHIPNTIPGVLFTEPCSCKNMVNEILEYDAGIHPGDRTKYWNIVGEYPLMKCVIAKQDGKVVGFGCIQPQVVDYRIAPKYADTEIIAKVLFKKLYLSICTENLDAELYVDFANINNSIPFYERELGLQRIELCNIRMYQGKDIEVPWHKVYTLSHYALFAT